MVTAQNLAGRTGRLHGADDPEIVFCVLQVVLGEDAVPGRGGVSRQLLVFFEDVLGVAADLRAFRPVGIERPVGVLLLGLPAATAATAAAIATALTLHTLEISHYSLTVPPALQLMPRCAGLPFRLAQVPRTREFVLKT